MKNIENAYNLQESGIQYEFTHHLCMGHFFNVNCQQICSCNKVDNNIPINNLKNVFNQFIIVKVENSISV